MKQSHNRHEVHRVGLGTVRGRYLVRIGAASALAAAVVTGGTAFADTITGTNRAETLIGTPQADTIQALSRTCATIPAPKAASRSRCTPARAPGVPDRATSSC